MKYEDEYADHQAEAAVERAYDAEYERGYEAGGDDAKTGRRVRRTDLLDYSRGWQQGYDDGYQLEQSADSGPARHVLDLTEAEHRDALFTDLAVWKLLVFIACRGERFV